MGEVRIVAVLCCVVVSVSLVAAPAMKNYYCKYCGLKSSSIASLTSSKCQRHPDGALKGRHEPAL